MEEASLLVKYRLYYWDYLKIYTGLLVRRPIPILVMGLFIYIVAATIFDVIEGGPLTIGDMFWTALATPICILIFIVDTLYRASMAYSSLADKTAEILLDIHGGYLKMQVGETFSSLPIKNLHRIREFSKYFLLYTSAGVFSPIPKRYLSLSDQQVIRNISRELK